MTLVGHDAEQHEICVFRGTGAGDLTMERLIREGQLEAVMDDLTTAEISDHLCGGVFTVGPNRMQAGAEKVIPMVVSVGACAILSISDSETQRRTRISIAVFLDTILP